jgi:mono/diheme cytochrome c family protein
MGLSLVVTVAAVAIVVQEAPAQTQAPKLSPAATQGKILFKSTGCGKCHTLAAASSTGTIGPNLDKLKLSLATIAHQISAGGGFMPSFGTRLSKTKINNIAAFVYASTHP